MNYRFSEDSRAMEPSPIRRLAQYAVDPDYISFAAGLPNPETFPVAELGEVLTEIARSAPVSALQYGMTRGHPKMVAAGIDILGRRGIEATKEALQVTAGSQRGLDLIGRVLLDPGDVVIVEVPSYPGALACFRSHQVRLVGTPQDGGGVIIEALEERLATLHRRGVRPKALYTIPNFQNPSGATLEPPRRDALAEIADRYDFLIIEDDPYGDLYFSDAAAARIAPIRPRAPERTLYLTTMSKIFAPGLRTGLVNGPAAIMERLELAAQSGDLCSSMLDQYIVAEMWRRGAIQNNLPRIRAFYRAQCEAFTRLLDERMPAGVAWSRPEGGFFLWLSGPEEFDAEAALQTAIARKLLYVPGAHFCVDGSGRNAMRLSFSRESGERMERGVAVLAELFSSQE